MGRICGSDHRSSGRIIIPGSPGQTLIGKVLILDEVAAVGPGAFLQLDVVDPGRSGGFPDPDTQIDGGRGTFECNMKENPCCSQASLVPVRCEL